MSASLEHLGVVVIGRNEGRRLQQCLAALGREGCPVVYADSGSEDTSVEVAQNAGAVVVVLDDSRPFTAARGRNEGLAKLLSVWPSARYVQFLDGDCEVAAGWLSAGLRELDSNQRLAVVFGRLRERHREASVYNRLCDMEWNVPAGDVAACGGNAMMRVEALQQTDGFRKDLIAGEEPELCLRLRRGGWGVRKIEVEMATHDAEMTRLGQWWRRTVRSGHAYGEAAVLHGWRDPTAWRRTASIWLWGWLLAAVALGAAPWAPWSLLLLGGYPLLASKVAWNRRRRGDGWRDAWLYGWFTVLGKLAQLQGQVQWMARRLLGGRPRLVEYRAAPRREGVGARD